jgi:D-methionine transport system ATP-binding protein
MENIELPLALAAVNKSKRKERAMELIDYFKLEQLLTGFQKPSAAAKDTHSRHKALANKPKIIIADEPASSIDDENTQILMDLFTSINRQEKVTIVLSTTDLYEKMPVHKDYLLKDGNLKSAQPE